MTATQQTINFGRKITHERWLLNAQKNGPDFRTTRRSQLASKRLACDCVRDPRLQTNGSRGHPSESMLTNVFTLRKRTMDRLPCQSWRAKTAAPPKLIASSHRFVSLSRPSAGNNLFAQKTPRKNNIELEKRSPKTDRQAVPIKKRSLDFP